MTGCVVKFLKIAPLARTVSVPLVGGRDASSLDDHNWVRGRRDREFIYPGNKYEPTGFILTTVLGIVGAVVATYLGEPDLDFPGLTGDAPSGGQIEYMGHGRKAPLERLFLEVRRFPVQRTGAHDAALSE